MSQEKRFDKASALSRRSLFAAGWAALAGSAIANADPQAAGAASDSAAPASRLKTLVCVYLVGGSDGNSFVAPLEPSQYSAWAAARGELGIRADALLPIRPRSSGAAFGLYYNLPELQKYFTQGSAAVVANIGPSTRPSRIAEAGQPAASSRGRYDSLSFLPGGYLTLGWAAKKAGATVNNDVAFTLANSVSVTPIGKTRFQGERRQNPEVMQKIAAASFRTPFPDSAPGRQMRNAAGLIRAGNVTGAPAQVIFCPVAGFGTSSFQAIMKPPKYRELSLAISALYEATLEMGVADSVTIFTDSEYGRTLRPNGRHGADPGWGNHHFVLGGAVRGGELFGRYPDMVSGPFDSDSALIPTTSSAQYYAALATWLGIPAAELPELLPDLNGAPPLPILRS
jgi:uncharacterized protein (DUF1501 family)